MHSAEGYKTESNLDRECSSSNCGLKGHALLMDGILCPDNGHRRLDGAHNSQKSRRKHTTRCYKKPRNSFCIHPCTKLLMQCSPALHCGMLKGT